MKYYYICIYLLFLGHYFENGYPMPTFQKMNTVETGEQEFSLVHIYTIFDFLKNDEAYHHTSLFFLDNTLELKAKYLATDLDKLASQMIRDVDIDWLKKLDQHMEIRFNNDFKKCYYYEIFKSIYINKFSWKEQKKLVFDSVLNRIKPQGLLSDFLQEFETTYKIGSSKTHIRWNLSEQHDLSLLFLFYQIIKIQDYSHKVMIVCKFKSTNITFYINPEKEGSCVGIFKEGIGKRMFNEQYPDFRHCDVIFYQKLFNKFIKNFEIDSIGYDFK